MRHANPKPITESRLDGEILFDTPFGYMFSGLARDTSALLPASDKTIAGLKQLGAAMAAPSPGDPDRPDALDSGTPAVFTYLGQFIDHEITARTDRNSEAEKRLAIGDGAITPIPSSEVPGLLFNGRRLQLDLDSVYGDGPGLIPGVETIASGLYTPDGKLRVYEGRYAGRSYVDLPRRSDKSAIIGDARNDENVVVSQLHASFLKFHNVVAQIAGNRFRSDYAEGRQLVRWCYQYLVAHEYLPTVCDANVVDDVMRNGPRFYNPLFQSGNLFMPLEFSVAAFRFGHSMIRPKYRLNKDQEISIFSMLMPAAKRPAGGAGDPGRDPLVDAQLKGEFSVDWDNFVGNKAQRARKIDAKIARGLFALGFDGPGATVLNQLAQRNLLRGYLLSIPTGQAIAGAMGIKPLSKSELLDGAGGDVTAAFKTGDFGDRTPLWYYILREAELQKGGESLGAVGSRIVAETLIGLLKADPNSFLNGAAQGRYGDDGINVGGRIGKIASLSDLLQSVGLLDERHHRPGFRH